VEVELLAPLANLEWVSVHSHVDKPLNPQSNLNSEVEILLDEDE
jgi:hypothetical protein